MITDKTVIISCAGIGKRLGRGVPKATVEVCGEPMILRMLKMLDDVDDVRVVVGYQPEKVIDIVLSYRWDVTFVFNHDYLNTGTGASVLLAAKYARDFILTIDGDVIVHPDDMKKILKHPSEFVGVTDILSDDSVLAEIKNNKVAGFSRMDGQYEWTGIAQIKSKNLPFTNGHVYEILEPLLPLPIMKIRTREIDTENDFVVACNWVKGGYSD